jgi:hypothetical protein
MAGHRYLLETTDPGEGAGAEAVNTAAPQNSSERLADLKRFNVDAREALPQVTKTGRGEACKYHAKAEYGCVEWYQYYAPAHEDRATH